MDATKIFSHFIVNNPRSSFKYEELTFKKEKSIQAINLLPIGGKFNPCYDSEFLTGIIESISFREGNKKEDIIIVTVRKEIENLHKDMLERRLKENGWRFLGTKN